MESILELNAMNNNNNNNGNEKKKKPPIYITIGAQCTGKTTFLSQLQQRITGDPQQKITDISIDDQPGVYMPIDPRYFIESPSPYGNNNRNNNHYRDERFLNRRIISKTIGFRIAEQEELQAILQRIAGRLSRDEFQSIIYRVYRKFATNDLSRRHHKDGNITEEMIRADYHSQVATTVVEIVEEFVGRRIPNQIDLFCVEALFRAHPQTKRTAIEVAVNKLHEVATTTSDAVAWGNTNTRPREYKTALSAAVASGRQVYFIVYGDSSRVSNGAVLPVIEFTDLYRRNLNRLLEAGRFVPAKAIWDASERIDSFLNGIIEDLDRSTKAKTKDNTEGDDNEKGGEENTPIIHSKFEFDKVLARMANFELNEDRTVQHISPPKKESNSSQHKRNLEGGTKDS